MPAKSGLDAGVAGLGPGIHEVKWRCKLVVKVLSVRRICLFRKFRNFQKFGNTQGQKKLNKAVNDQDRTQLLPESAFIRALSKRGMGMVKAISFLRRSLGRGGGKTFLIQGLPVNLLLCLSPFLVLMCVLCLPVPLGAL